MIDEKMIVLTHTIGRAFALRKREQVVLPTGASTSDIGMPCCRSCTVTIANNMDALTRHIRSELKTQPAMDAMKQELLTHFADAMSFFANFTLLLVTRSNLYHKSTSTKFLYPTDLLREIDRRELLRRELGHLCKLLKSDDVSHFFLHEQDVSRYFEFAQDCFEYELEAPVVSVQSAMDRKRRLVGVARRDDMKLFLNFVAGLIDFHGPSVKFSPLLSTLRQFAGTLLLVSSVVHSALTLPCPCR